MLRRIIALLLIVSLVAGCAITPMVAPPPLPPKPKLESITFDFNDHTGALGVWMSFQDLRELTKAWEGVEAAREKWK